MEYSVVCACGARHRATAPMAGSTIDCACGRQVAVPLLSELRTSAGADPYASSARDRIVKRLNLGEIPPENGCAYCGAKTSDYIRIQAVCEQRWVKGKTSNRAGMISLIRSIVRPLASVLAELSGQRRQAALEQGHDVVVMLPVRLCESCRGQHADFASQAAMRELLAKIPLYVELLTEHPDAEFYRA